MHLPVFVVHGDRPGPTVWLSAAVHGDELNGIAIVRGVLSHLDARAFRGTLLAAPIVNAFGLISESRYLPDRRDLNRSFPGSKHGSLAAQLAYLFMQQIVRRCSFGIDFHTGSQGRTNLPQVRCDFADPALRRLAEVFAPPAILHAPMRPGSLRAAASRLGIGSFLYEAGEDKRFDTTAIAVGISGVLRVMRHLKMIDKGPAGTPPTPVVARRTLWVRARRGGMCQMSVGLGENVTEGQRIATVFDPLAREDIAVRARTSGLIVGILNHALVNRGEAIAHIAEPSPRSSRG
jgi:predicted deacylase